MQIDAHQHYWSLSRGDYGWLTPGLAAIYRDFGPDDLRPLLERHRIDRTILVQAAPTVAETEFLLAIASTTPTVAGVVGWIDFNADDAAETIARLAQNRTLVGLRPMVHDIADVNWLMRLDLAPAIEAMIAYDLVFDALVKPPHLPALRGFVARYPKLRVVVDHGAKPEIAASRIEPWLTELRAIAAHSQVACKLSGLITEAASDWRPDDVLPYIAMLLRTVRTRPAALGQRLAGGRSRRRLRCLARFDGGSAARAFARRSCGCARWQCGARLLRPWTRES